MTTRREQAVAQEQAVRPQPSVVRDRQQGAELALTGIGLGFVGIGVLVAHLVSLTE